MLVKLVQWLNLSKARYQLADVTHQPGDISIYRLRPVGRKQLPLPGQFFYLKHKFLGESHPFSVLEYDPESGELVFAIKAVGPFTQQLARLPLGAELWVDGPYGVFGHQAKSTHPKVIIAGGIGVVPFVELVKQKADENTFMLYANQKLEHAVARDLFKALLQDRYCDFISRENCTGKNIISSRINEQYLGQLMSQELMAQAEFYLCGTSRFINGIKAMLQNLGVANRQIHFEEFDF